MERIVAAHELYLKDDSEKLVNIKPKVRAVVVEGNIVESYNKLVGVRADVSFRLRLAPHPTAPQQVVAQEDTLVLMRTSQYRTFLEGPLAENLVVGETSYQTPTIANRTLDLMASSSTIKVNAKLNDPDDLREALRLKTFQELARLHMTTHHCEEVLEFYLAAEGLVGADAKEPSAEDIKKCFSRFLCEGAPSLVSGLDVGMRKAVSDALGESESGVAAALERLVRHGAVQEPQDPGMMPGKTTPTAPHPLFSLSLSASQKKYQSEAQGATYELMRSGFWHQFLACDDGKRLVVNE